MSPLCTQKLARWQTMVGERAAWAIELAQLRRLRPWVLAAEPILQGSWAQPGERVSNETVGSRLDRWRQRLTSPLTKPPLSELEQACLTEFLQVLANLRP